MGKYFNSKNGTFIFGKGSDSDLEKFYSALDSVGAPQTTDYLGTSDQGILGGFADSLLESFFGEGMSSLNLGQSLKSWLDSMSGSELTNAQKQMNDFNSSEALLNRDFQSQQAELAYERQKDFYEQYQSIGAQMRQYHDAGLNPALMYGGGASVASSAPSSSIPSGSSASGSQSSNPMALVSFVMQLAGLKANIDKTKAETNEIKEHTKLTTQQVVESVARVNNIDADTLKIADERAKIAKDIAVSDSDIALKQQQVATLISQSVLNDKKGELITEETELTKGEQRKLDYVIEDLIADTNLTKRQSDVALREYHRLVQDYGHQDVMNSIIEISSSRNAGAGEHSNGYYRAISEVKRFIDSILGWWSGSTSLNFNKK